MPPGHRIRYAVMADGCQGQGAGRFGAEKVKGLRGTNWQLRNSHRDVKYSIRNIVSNILTILHGAGWGYWQNRGKHCKVYDCLPTVLYA